MITNDVRHTREIKLRIVMAKAVFSMLKTFLPANLTMLKEETNEILHLEHSFVWE
jgi:hypothetical protein